MMPQGNLKIKTNPDVIQHYFGSALGYFNAAFSIFSFDKPGESLNVGCSGWDIKPWSTKFETDRIVWRAQLDKNVKPNPDYCGQADGELYLSDPRKLQNNMY